MKRPKNVKSKWLTIQYKESIAALWLDKLSLQCSLYRQRNATICSYFRLFEHFFNLRQLLQQSMRELMIEMLKIGQKTAKLDNLLLA